MLKETISIKIYKKLKSELKNKKVKPYNLEIKYIVLAVFDRSFAMLQSNT